MKGFFVIDLFCGAGGTSLGFDRAKINGVPIAEVIACINHDAVAIRSHSENFPACKHLVEDVRHVNMAYLKSIVRNYRKANPGKKMILWASLECTHFSNAKTGARSADSRTLAWALYRYIKALSPDLLMIENVREFMSWGDLDEAGKPINRKKGIEYVKWYQTIEGFGYRYNYKLLNSADFGSHQSRLRYFGVFAKPGIPIVFPNPTHDKTGKNGLEKWKPVREVLDLDQVGKSIFNRKKPLSAKTLKRVLAGLLKFADGPDQSYIVKHYGGDPASKSIPLSVSCSTITTIPHESLVHIQKNFLFQYNGLPAGSVFGVNAPCRTITTKDRIGIARVNWIDNRTINGKPCGVNQPHPTLVTNPTQSIVTVFIDNQYGTGVPNSIEEPAHTLATVPKKNLVTAAFIDRQFGNSKCQSIDQPCGALTTEPKTNLVTAFLMPTNYTNTPVSLDRPCPTITANRKWHYLVNPQFGWPAVSIEQPCFTLIAKMDKRPPYLLTTQETDILENKNQDLPIPDGYYQDESIDPETRIRTFMRTRGISDIFMRMLNIWELKRIQGLGTDYILHGPQDQQKKSIGNAVVPDVVTAWAEAYYMELYGMIQAIKTIHLPVNSQLTFQL